MRLKALREKARRELGPSQWRKLVLLSCAESALLLAFFVCSLAAVRWAFGMTVYSVARQTRLGHSLDAPGMGPLLRGLAEPAAVALLLLGATLLVSRAVDRTVEPLRKHGCDLTRLFAAIPPRSLAAGWTRMVQRWRVPSFTILHGMDEGTKAWVMRWHRIGTALEVLAIVLLGVAALLGSMRWPRLAMLLAVYGNPEHLQPLEVGPGDWLRNAFLVVLFGGLLPVTTLWVCFRLRLKCLLAKAR